MIIDIEVDTKKVVACINTQSTKEKKTEVFLKDHGGLDAVLKVR